MFKSSFSYKWHTLQTQISIKNYVQLPANDLGSHIPYSWSSAIVPPGVMSKWWLQKKREKVMVK